MESVNDVTKSILGLSRRLVAEPCLCFCSFFDPNLTDKSFNRLNRKHKVGFDFVKAGTFQKEAEQRRLKVRLFSGIECSVAVHQATYCGPCSQP